MLGEGVTFLSEILICSDYESFLYKPTYLNEPSFVNGKNEDKWNDGIVRMLSNFFNSIL